MLTISLTIDRDWLTGKFKGRNMQKKSKRCLLFSQFKRRRANIDVDTGLSYEVR